MAEGRSWRGESDFERVAVELSTRFINFSSDEIEEGIRDALGTIGEFFGADRAYIGRFTVDHRRFTLTHEWNDPAVPKAARNWIAVPSSMFAGILRSFLRNETVFEPRIREMENVDARDRILASGTQSLMLTPLMCDGSLWGFVGLSSTVEELDWPAHAPRLLSVFGQMCVTAMERKRSEAALRMTQYSVEHAADAAYWLTSDARFCYVNEAACESLGYTKEELLRKSVHDIDPRLPKEKWDEHWKDVAAKGRVTIESVHRRRDGSEFPVEIRINHHRFEGRDYHFAFARDITSRQKTEREMDFQDAFRQLITRISARFINISPDEIDSELEQALAEVGEFARVDRSYIFRLTPDGEGMSVVAEWCREGVTDRVRHLESFPLGRAAWWHGLMRQNEVFHLTSLDEIPPGASCLRDALESLGHRSLVEVPILQRGAMVGFLGLATVEQETEWSGSTISVLRILGEIAANAFAGQRAEEERIRLATAAQQTAESVLITDDECRIQYVNPAFERTSGQSRKEVVGRNLQYLYGDVEGGALFHNLLARLAENQHWSGRVSRRRADGSALEEDVSITAIRDVHGQMLGYVVVGRDMTEQMRMEALLRQSQKMEAIGQLAGGIAHDFNNLLQAIKGYTALARSVLDPGGQVHSYLGEVERASDRAGDLVRQLLTFSRRSPSTWVWPTSSPA